ncbi:MAG TPA: response regulator, partial [Sphingomicrobium sp.]|nr:response regulator [Sphingomicrobium sp.]
MKAERISENRTRSLLLLDADPDERRLVSAIAGRAGWSVIGSACGETAVGLLQGPHGREVQAALIGNWDSDTGPELIAELRSCRENLPIIVVADGDSVAVAVEAMRAGATDFLSRPVVQERLIEALA